MLMRLVAGSMKKKGCLSERGLNCDLIVDGQSEGFSFELVKTCVVLNDKGTFRRSVGIRVARLTSGNGSVD